MKYPKEQHKIIIDTLQALKQVPELGNIREIPVLQLFGICTDLHYSHQKHNRIVKTSNGHKRMHSLSPNESFEFIIEPQDSIDLYPRDCNDAHLTTAMKAALNEVFKN